MRYLRAEGKWWAAVLALIALHIKILIPLGQAIPIGQDENGAPISLVICSLYGTQVINVRPGEEIPDKPDSNHACPVCMALSFSTTLNDFDPGELVKAPQAGVVASLFPAEVHITSQFLPGSRTARAPPAFA
ncbi:MAG: hypothetical protein P8Y36_14205 [Alphaproteobacteria bacterium]